MASRVDIESLKQNLTVVQGGDLGLECRVQKMKTHQQIIWRKGFEVIAAGASVLKPDFRYSVKLGPSSSRLKIEKIALPDEGEFVCQVQTGLGLEEIKHHVTVQGRRKDISQW